MIDRRLITSFDWKVLLLILLITAVGILNIYSASASYRVVGTPYALKQFYWSVIGIGLILMICSIDYHILEDVSYWCYGTIIIFLLLVLVAGKTSMGATRWLNLGLFTMQPSEPMKIVIIITLARYFTRNQMPGLLGLRGISIPLLILLLPAALIVKQPDLGTAIMVCLVAATIMVAVGIRWSVILSLVLTSLPLIVIAWHFLLHTYQKNRILNFLSPERDPLKSGYHLIQSKIAVGSGGIFGKGFMHGTQTQLRFLPEQHTDFAFSVFAEEWGLLGSVIVLILYLALVLWGLHVASRCNDRFGTLLAVGVTAMLFWHIVINMGMVIGLFPVVGVPLPFFSYGGTSMITSMVGAGILLNISMRRFMF
ncbi:MAG TPA: rod shape-determining protein RodA [Geobacteraceae bacterium]|nr:rod shape-determining protein RodA [Geobacteraceae bacterium]